MTAGLGGDRGARAGGGEAQDLLRAAIRLRWRAGDLAESGDRQVVEAVGALMEAISAAASADSHVVPTPIRRAAARLARRIDHERLTGADGPRTRSRTSSPCRRTPTGPGRAPDSDVDALRLPAPD